MMTFLWTESCGSTQEVSKSLDADRAQELGIDLKEFPLLPLASRVQFAGKGRGGSEWKQAPVGDVNHDKAHGNSAPIPTDLIASDLERAGEIFLDFPPTTFRVDPKLLKVPLSWLPLMVGCAVIDALEDLLNFFLSLGPQPLKVEMDLNKPFKLKWPNDVLIQMPDGTHKKICGILCETSFLGTVPGAIHVGVGLNLMRHPQIGTSSSVLESLFFKAAASKEPGRKQKFQKMLGDKKLGSMLTQRFFMSLVKELNEYLFVNRSRGQLRGLVLERSLAKGTHLVVNKGERQGAFVGLNLEGALILEGQSAPIHAGDVSLGDPLPSPESRMKKLVNAVAQVKLADFRVVEPDNMVLCMDLGNTRIHWQLAEGAQDEVSWQNIFDAEKEIFNFDQFKPLFLALSKFKTHRVVFNYVSVVAPKKSLVFVKRLQDHLLSLFPEMKFETNVFGATRLLEGTPLSDQYELGSLGADRALRFWHCWKTAVKLGKPVAWLSVGTATTLECVSPEGKILESWIGPGITHALEVMQSKTEQLPPISLNEANIDSVVRQDRPCTTEQSMLNGVLLPLFKSLLQMIDAKSIAEIFVSGGNAVRLADALEELFDQKTLLILDPLLERKCILNFYRESLMGSDPVQASGGLSRKAPKVSEALPEKLIAGLSDPFQEKQVQEDKSLDVQSKRSPLSTQLLLKSLRRGRVVKAADLYLKPTREHFRRLGLRLESVAEGKEPRLDRYLAEKFRFHNRETWRQRVMAGEVLVQSNAPQRNAFEAPEEGLRSVKCTYKLKNYDLLWLFHPPEYEPDFVDSAEVVYDDGDAIVFSKPGNLVVHASGLYGKNTFVDVISRMGFGAAAAVHRLDRETSGALLCARTPELRRQLALAFRQSRVKKMYLAISKTVEARNLPNRFMVRKPIGPAIGSKIRLKLWTDEHPDAQDAATAFERLSTWEGYTLWACFPVTGRTNQIRIHLASVGEWIVGDKMYHPNEDVFITFYEEGLTPWVLQEALFHRHLLHNAGLQAIGNFPHLPIFSNPIAVPLSEDVYEFEPAVKLLSLAGLSLEADLQKQQLLTLFSGFCWNALQELESIE